MDLQILPTEEQEMLRESVRRWASTRDVREPGNAEADWAYGAEQGWLMAGLPEVAGGLGGSDVDSAVIAEELGRALVRSGFVECGMVGAHLLLAVSPERAEEVALGGAKPVLAHDEPGMRGHFPNIETKATENDGWKLTGTKSAIVGEPTSLVVSARQTDGALALFEIGALSAPVRSYETIDQRAGIELHLEDTPAQLLLSGSAAENALKEAIDRALVLESAEALGAMEAAFDMTRDYLMTRKQYGQLIGEFQALRHRIADMFIELEQARSILQVGLSGLASGKTSERAKLAAATRARVAQAGLFVCGQAIQLHGGIGVTDEYPVGHFYKRLVAFANRHGGEARQVERFAELAYG
ncbi:acyl-CoA dehydrogenase family protein [Erythrobacter litoralis]|uniref:acyl-CoA dehydrogenase family protein n=1 Tax=Erythrobacter litoralis TaxID=39960 RepID=UPI00243533E9|nr:acyl-CoA dehydrogenase [Erythrobacter litoralis]